MGILIIIILLLIIIALQAAKYIPYLIILAVLYSIFGNATLGVLLIFGIFYFKKFMKEDTDKE